MAGVEEGTRGEGGSQGVVGRGLGLEKVVPVASARDSRDKQAYPGGPPTNTKLGAGYPSLLIHR